MTLHLLACCPGTSFYRAAHGISLETLAFNTQANMLAAACFNSFLAHTLPFDNYPRNQHAIDKALSLALDSRKQKLVQTSLQSARDSARKRHRPNRECLVLPISNISINSARNTVATETNSSLQQGQRGRLSRYPNRMDGFKALPPAVRRREHKMSPAPDVKKISTLGLHPHLCQVVFMQLAPFGSAVLDTKRKSSP